MISTLLLVILTVLLPPLGVYCVAGCGADVIINICLTLLGYFPGHIHAFYILYIFYSRKEQQQTASPQQGGGNYQQNFRPAPGIYSTKVQSGGFVSSSRRGRGGGDYGTIAAAAPAHPPN